jgi:hypothetical protein
LGTADEIPTPLCSLPPETEAAEELLSPSDETAGVGEPYTRDGIIDAEEPSLPDDIGNS